MSKFIKYTLDTPDSCHIVREKDPIIVVKTAKILFDIRFFEILNSNKTIRLDMTTDARLILKAMLPNGKSKDITFPINKYKGNPIG
jgi:hypothetical protein